MEPQTSENLTETTPKPLGWMQIVTLHLAPGLLIALVFVGVAWATRSFGWPASLPLLITWVLVGLPLLWGILLAQGRGAGGKITLDRVLLNREPLPLGQYLWLVPLLLIWAALASTLLFPLAETIRATVFSGWPAWLDLSALARNLAQYPPSILWAIVGLSAVTNIAVPITEELYFRSFLMPRLPASARWAPLISGLLFSLYHFWLPWDLIGRLVTLLPLLYAVQWKRNVRLSIWVHVLLNLLGTVGLVVVILGTG